MWFHTFARPFVTQDDRPDRVNKLGFVREVFTAYARKEKVKIFPTAFGDCAIDEVAPMLSKSLTIIATS
jgi:hypothetical protein